MKSGPMPKGEEADKMREKKKKSIRGLLGGDKTC